MGMPSLRSIFLVKEVSRFPYGRGGRSWNTFDQVPEAIPFQELKRKDATAAQRWREMYADWAKMIADDPESHGLSQDDVIDVQNQDIDPSTIDGIMTYFVPSDDGGWFAHHDGGSNPTNENFYFDPQKKDWYSRSGEWSMHDPKQKIPDERQRAMIDDFEKKYMGSMGYTDPKGLRFARGPTIRKKGASAR